MLSNNFFGAFSSFYVFEGKHKVPFKVKSLQIVIEESLGEGSGRS
jgi:hypothetical protein